MKTWKSFVKRNIEWMILSAVLFFLHVLYLFLIGRTGDDLIYAGILRICVSLRLPYAWHISAITEKCGI